MEDVWTSVLGGLLIAEHVGIGVGGKKLRFALLDSLYLTSIVTLSPHPMACGPVANNCAVLVLHPKGTLKSKLDGSKPQADDKPYGYITPKVRVMVLARKPCAEEALFTVPPLYPPWALPPEVIEEEPREGIIGAVRSRNKLKLMRKGRGTDSGRRWPSRKRQTYNKCDANRWRGKGMVKVSKAKGLLHDRKKRQTRTKKIRYEGWRTGGDKRSSGFNEREVRQQRSDILRKPLCGPGVKKCRISRRRTERETRGSTIKHAGEAELAITGFAENELGQEPLKSDTEAEARGKAGETGQIRRNLDVEKGQIINNAKVTDDDNRNEGADGKARFKGAGWDLGERVKVKATNDGEALRGKGIVLRRGTHEVDPIGMHSGDRRGGMKKGMGKRSEQGTFSGIEYARLDELTTLSVKRYGEGTPDNQQWDLSIKTGGKENTAPTENDLLGGRKEDRLKPCTGSLKEEQRSRKGRKQMDVRRSGINVWHNGKRRAGLLDIKRNTGRKRRGKVRKNAKKEYKSRYRRWSVSGGLSIATGDVRISVRNWERRRAVEIKSWARFGGKAQANRTEKLKKPPLPRRKVDVAVARTDTGTDTTTENSTSKKVLPIAAELSKKVVVAAELPKSAAAYTDLLVWP
ncbi:hypothetical protein Tco_0676615 [Tanacetum coccineum]